MLYILSNMANRKRTLFYLGLLIFALAVIFLTYVLYVGPYNKFSEKRTITYDHPSGEIFKDVRVGDKLELNYESSKPVNVILIRTKDSGDYFLLEDRTVEHFVLAAEATSGNIEHTFQSSGDWGIYFENPRPPPRDPPVVEYWGQLKMERENITMHYLNITVAIIFIILGLILIFSSRTKKPQQKPTTKKKKTKNKKKT